MEEVKIPISLEDGGFETGAKRIIDRMEATQKEVDKTGLSVDAFARHMQEVYQRFDKLTGAVHENTAAIGKDSKAARQLGRDFDETAEKGVAGFSRLEKAAIGFFTLQKAKDFIGEVYEVRSEIEKLETSFRILVGDKAKADALFASIRKFAVETPMQLKDLAGAAQTMMGFGIATEDVMENLKALGNVVMGDSQKFQSLALAFSQMSATGKLMGQDLLQMINAGFNPLDQMAKTTGKSIAELKEEMSQGAISADMVRQAFIDATSEGGKFNGMLEAQSKNLAGAYSNLQGAIDDMLNDIGEKGEGLFAGAIEGATDLVKNYEKVASVLQDIIVAYGLYKGALMTADIAQKAHVAVLELTKKRYIELRTTQGLSMAAARAEAAQTNILTVAKVRLTAATKSLTAAMMANPYVAVAMAVAGLCFGIYKLATAEDAETAARRRANEEMKKFSDQLDEQKSKIQGYIQTLQDSNATEYQKAEAWEMLNKMAPTLTEKYTRAELATLDLAEATKQLNEQAEKANYTHLREEVKKWQEAIERINQNMLDDARYNGGKNAIFNLQQLEGAEAQLDSYLKKLAEIDRIRAKMIEDNKPLEIRIQEANENAEAKAEIYNFYKRAADLAGELKTAHDIAAGTIANSSIPQDYEAIADSARQKYDDLIAELEKDVEDLRTKIAESPASLELEKELKGKEQALNDLLQMKREWAWSGATTIPLTFQWNFSQVEKALRDAQSGVGKNTDGMKWVTDYVSQAGGHWEKDEAHADTRTAAQWRQQAYGNWKKAQKAVDEFWLKKESMDKASFDKEYDRLKGIADQAKKDYDKLKGTSGSKSQKNEAAERAKKMQEYLDLIEKQRVEQERAVRDMELDTEQARIDAMEEGSAKTLCQLKLDFEKQKEELLRGYEGLKQTKLDAAKQLFEANPKNKGKVFDPSSVNITYTEQEMRLYEEQLKAITKAYERSLNDRKKLEREAITEYLEEYGTYEQKRLAIMEDYSEKIREARENGMTGDVLKLEREMEKALSGLDMSKFEKSINWELLFNDLDKLSVEHLNKLKQQLKEALSNDDLTADQAKVITERISAINDQLQTKSKEWKNAFGLVIPELEKMRRLEQDALEANERKIQAQERLNKSLEKEKQIRDEILKLLQQNGITANGSDITATNQDTYIQMMQGQGKNVKDLSNLFSKLGKQEAQVAQNTEALAGAEAEAGAAAESAGGSFAQTVAIIDTIVHKINENVQSLNELLEQMDLADTKFGKGFSKFAESSQYATDAWESLKSGNVMGVANGVYGSLRTLGEALGEWGISGFGSSDTSLHDDMELLTQSNKDLKMAIDELAKVMEDSAVAEATEIFSQQKSKIEDSIKNTLELMQRASSAYSNGFLGIGGHHSSGHKINEGISSAEWDRISNLLGKSVRSAGDFFNLTSQEMYRVATELTDIYSHIKDLADDGYENAAQFMDEYISYWQQLEELQNAYYEKMTSVSFDTIESDFKSVLLDMDSDAEDFAKNFEKYLQEAVINSLISEKYKPLLESWYHAFSSYMEDGMLSEAERIALLQGGHFFNKATGAWESYTGWDSMTDQALRERNALRDAFGWGEETAESKKYFENLRDMWLSTLMDMEADAESWRKEITRIMVEDLINSLVLGDDFEEWLANWKERYADEMAHGGDTDRLKALIDEMVAKRKELAEQSQGIMDDLGYTDLMKEIEESADAFEDLHDNFLDALMDMDTDAEEWGKKIAQTLARQIIEQQLLNQAFDGILDEWKAAVADLVQNDLGHIGGDEQTLDMLKGKIAEIVEKYKELAPLAQEFLQALGLIEEAKLETPFKNLRQSFLNTLLDMKADAESFRRELDKTLVQDMIEKFIFDVKMTVNGQDFDNFDAYLEDWNERYLAIFQNGELTKEQKESQLQALIDELMAERDALDAASADLRERLKEIEESVPDSTFKDMADSWVSTLMDMDATAEDWAEEIGRTMARRIVEQMVQAQMIQPLLDQLQEAFNTAMSAEGATWQSVLPELAPYIDQIKTAFGDMQPIVEQILNAFGIFKEVEEEVKDGFGDLRSTFVSSLMDMEADAEKFAKDIARIMTEQMVSKIIEQRFQDQIDALSAEWFDALEASDTEALERIRQKVIELQRLCGEAVQPLLDDLREIEYVEEVEVDETISSMRDNWLSALMDMKAGTQDFVNDIKKLLTQKLVEKFVLNSAFDSWLQGMQSQYDAIFNGSMTEEQAAAAMNRLAAEWEAKAKEMQEQTQAIFDLTGWSTIVEQMNSPLADLRSNFRSSLMDMESDAEDFAGEISKILTEAFIDKFVLGDEFDKRLAEWQEQYAAIMKGNYSEEERASLLKQLQQAIAAAKEGYAAEAQAIHDLMGTGNASDQGATMNMADKATYDQFETYLGIAVAQQMATLQGNDVREQILATLRGMTGITTPSGDTVKEIRTMLNTSNEYLLDIKRSNRSILNLFGEKLDTIISRLHGLI